MTKSRRPEGRVVAFTRSAAYLRRRAQEQRKRGARMEAVNSGNAELKSDGGIVYGRTGFDIDSYLSYELSALKNAYTGDESNPGMSLSDDEVRRYYDEHDWTKDGVDGKAPLDEVRGNVKAQMRSERYDELVSQRAEAIDVTDLPWDALYRFTAGRLG